MVDTIFEEVEDESEESLSSHAYSSPSSPDLSSSIESWSQVTGKRPDVKIHVEGECFYLHKDVVASKSGFLKRQLQQVSPSELNLSPPLKVTVEAFKIFAEFCYQCDVVLTPFNLAPLRTALEMLHITDDALRQKADSYFSHEIANKTDFAAAVFLSSLSLLPEAEDMAFLPSRCLQSMYLLKDSNEGLSACAECLKELHPPEFQIIVDSMQRRLNCGHDLLYKIVDLYLKVYEGNMSEEQKARICNSIDCNILSPQMLMHVVQNPRMPLRFIVQAMIIEQLNTHRPIFSANLARLKDPLANQEDETAKFSPDATTLGQSDDALRQVTQLRKAIDTTTSRIQNLEKELSQMKTRLIGSEKQGNDMNAGSLSCRSVSCRFSGNHSNKVERGERGSVSSTNIQFKALTGVGNEEDDVLERSLNSENSTSRNRKNLGNWLITRLKSAFGVSKKNLNKDMGHVILEKGDGKGSEAADTVVAEHQRR